MNSRNDHPTAPQFVMYTEEQRAHIKYNLEKSLGPEYVSFRSAAGGSQVVYIEGWKALNLANQIFGFNGWSSEVKTIQVDYVDNMSGKWSLGLSAIVRVTLKDGTFHEDIGYGNIENCKSKAMAFDKAKKEAVTDGVKRALRQFGNVLGNCLYEKNYLQKVKQVKKIERSTTEDQLLRPEENVRPQFDRNGQLVREKEELVPLPTKSREQTHNQQVVEPQGKIIPEDSYVEDSFLFSDEVFEEDENDIADHEVEALLDKNNKSPPMKDIARTPEPSKNVSFVSTRLARNLIENAPGLSPIPASERIAFNAQVRTPLHNKTTVDHTKSAPIKRTPATARKVIYESSKKPLPEDIDNGVPTSTFPAQSPSNAPATPTAQGPTSIPLNQIESNGIAFDTSRVGQKRGIGISNGRNGPNKRTQRSETS